MTRTSFCKRSAKDWFGLPTYHSRLLYHHQAFCSRYRTDNLQCGYIFYMLSPLAFGSIKLSILFFYRRIFRGGTFNHLNWILIVLTSLWTLFFFLVQTFRCGTHFPANWIYPEINAGYCLDSCRILLACSISDVIIDIFIMILPLPMASTGLHTRSSLRD